MTVLTLWGPGSHHITTAGPQEGVGGARCTFTLSDTGTGCGKSLPLREGACQAQPLQAAQCGHRGQSHRQHPCMFSISSLPPWHTGTRRSVTRGPGQMTQVAAIRVNPVQGLSTGELGLGRPHRVRWGCLWLNQQEAAFSLDETAAGAQG